MNAPASSDEHVATEDELLLELMDLVQLAFPQALQNMVVQFVENEDGKRPALKNLDARADKDAPQRPALGHDDNRVLDGINGLLNDFADATFRKAGLRVHHGEIRVTTGKDHDRFVELVDLASGAPVVVLTRRFDASELRWLFFTSSLFARLNATAAKEAEQQRALEVELSAYRRFDIDMAQGTITFSGREQDTPPRTWKFELLGSHVEEQQRFLWGFDNASVNPRLYARLDGFRLAQTAPGLRALAEGTFGCPEAMAQRLCRHAAAALSAFGVYRAPFAAADKKGFMYLALFGDDA